MNTRIRTFSIDCADPYTLAQFWSKLLDAPLGEEDFPGDPEVLVQLPEGPPLLFIQVPEPKTVKNRLHMCLEPGIARDDEVERVKGLGGTIVDDRRNADGTGWVVFADPEGNEFCVLRSEAERAATS